MNDSCHYFIIDCVRNLHKVKKRSGTPKYQAIGPISYNKFNYERIACKSA